MPTTTATSRSYRETLIVLRTYQLGESDRIIIGISSHHGLVRAVAKGVRRSTSKLGARLEPFMITDVSLVYGRNLDTVTQAVTRKAYAAPIVADYTSYTHAAGVAEVTEYLAQADEMTGNQLFTLTAGALSALARFTHDVTDIFNSFLIRSMKIAGWYIETERCVRCGSDEDLRAWSMIDGGLVCSACAQAGDRPVTPEVVAYLRAVATGAWETIDGMADRTVAERVGTLLQRYVQWHVEREFRTFALLERNS
ncbi:DNA repair protein RecO [Curtobacterium sp. S6]|uniref:DNA repair protein RecO n=1 Tax=Curtobacterium sp. S6 TaxID=1479623 RepID=UPI0004AA7D86|nr:DNA repair protein RecO [Curtobacterium sp. S6]